VIGIKIILNLYAVVSNGHDLVTLVRTVSFSKPTYGVGTYVRFRLPLRFNQTNAVCGSSSGPVRYSGRNLHSTTYGVVTNVRFQLPLRFNQTNRYAVAAAVRYDAAV
jgi:hypothetical protein